MGSLAVYTISQKLNTDGELGCLYPLTENVYWWEFGCL